MLGDGLLFGIRIEDIDWRCVFGFLRQTIGGVHCIGMKVRSCLLAVMLLHMNNYANIWSSSLRST